jgi:hypothetical protein
MIKLLLPLFVALNVNADSPGKMTTSESDQQCKSVTVTVCKGEKAVVVRKKAKAKKIAKPITEALIERQVVVEKRVVVTKTVDKTRRNTVFLYGQNKITNLDTKVSGNTASVESERNIVPGIGYQRQFDSGLMLGAGVDTQADVQLQVGISW